jgi:hypothetical protein
MNATPPLPLPFRITERDLALLKAIARFRFLSSRQLHHVVGGSERGVRNRLRLLTNNGYLVRDTAALTEPFAYGLCNRGARLLAERGEPVNVHLDWIDKNRRTDYFLAHTLEVADVMLQFETAVRDRVTLIDHHTLLPNMPEATQDKSDPFQLRVAIPHRDTSLTVPVIPDRLFALRYDNGTIHNFALELDRGTMDIWANRLVGKSSLRRKLLAYHYAREQRLFTQQWGFKSFRVLTVTTTEERVASMLKAQRRVAANCPPGFFLYSTPRRLADYGSLGPAWINCNSNAVSLCHQPPHERITT